MYDFTMEQVLQHYSLAPLLINKVLYIKLLLTCDLSTFHPWSYEESHKRSRIQPIINNYALCI
jgi:hypothetical protein